MPEIAPSPDYGRSINKAFYDRAMVLQAWATYGTLWPVVHQQLGVRPDMSRRGLSRFTIGHTLPRGASVGQVTLDGQPVAYTTVTSNRVEVSSSRRPPRARTSWS